MPRKSEPSIAILSMISAVSFQEDAVNFVQNREYSRWNESADLNPNENRRDALNSWQINSITSFVVRPVPERSGNGTPDT